MYVLLNQDNVVIDVQRVDPANIFAADYAARYVIAPDEVGIGYRKVGDQWQSPDQHQPVEPPAVPLVVSMRQARLALLHAGKLAAINAAIANLPGEQGDVVRIEWEFSTIVERSKPAVAAIAKTLDLTDADLDQLFIAAAKL